MENAGQDPAGQQAQADPQQTQGGSEGKDYNPLRGGRQGVPV